jgi:NTP pyrophosphatase (non-canonical NTP hydrolase)
MTFEDYQAEMLRTYHSGRVEGHALGLAGESGEVCDLIKKWRYHGVGYDRDAMKKELGDVLWYLTALAADHGFSLDGIAQLNIEKLKARYPDGFVKGGGIRQPEKVEHVCGLQGYCPGPPHFDPICPACEAAFKSRSKA